MGSPGGSLAVLVAAAGAPWESAALGGLQRARVVVVKRCVDLADLLATAGAGQASVAVVSPDLPGLDGDAVGQLRRHGVGVVAVGGEDPAALSRIGVAERLDAADLAALPDVVRRAAEHEAPPGTVARQDDPAVGRVLGVWGPAGAPGRTTVAVALAAELARRATTSGGRVVLADLDPYGGTVAQHLGVLDEVSGLLAAARLVNRGELDDTRYAGCRRGVSDGLEVLTGLPRADRWVEVRDGVVTELVERASGVGDVVADLGFCLEDSEREFGRRPGSGRHRMTLEALAAADEVLVVGSADPVGLTRLARGLVDLGDTRPGVPVRVVVNRMRDSLGWGEGDIRGMVEGFVRPQGVHFLPDDRPACDRALVTGRAVTEGDDSPLRRAVEDLADALAPAPAGPPARRGRRRRAQAPKSR